MKMIYVLILSALLTSTAFAFDGYAKHAIVRDAGFFTTDYTIDGQEASESEVEDYLIYVQDAYDKWKFGKTMGYVSLGMAAGGGFIIGYSALSGADYGAGDGYKIGITIGAGIFVAAIILNRVAASKLNGAIELYNSESGTIKNPYETSFNIQLAPTPQGGIGLAFNF